MSYTLLWKDPTVDPLKTPITVQVGASDTTSTSITLTGKGAANYGAVQQTNLLRLLENFAAPLAPLNATVGQIWYDTSTSTLRILSEGPDTWKAVGGIQVTEAGAAAPSATTLGSFWYERTGAASGFLYVYTGVGRYPSTSTTIGGWEQVHPDVNIAGGREEYDSLREMVEQLAGISVSAYGSGAISTAIQNLTNFGPLDQNLRVKYKALLPNDSVVLLSTASDVEITKQAISGTLFHHNDAGSSADGYISGSRTDIVTPGSIYLNGVVTPITPAILSHDRQVDNGFIMYTTTGAAPFASLPFSVIRFNEGTLAWEYDSPAVGWVQFSPTADHYIIGQHSTLQDDDDSVYPIDGATYMWASAVPMIGIKYEHLKVEPNSQDWDALLACAKYALNRLEVPPGFAKNVSTVPFVIDGRQAPASLLSLPTSDIRYPSARRRSNAKIGSVSQYQNYIETQNALQTGIENRFSLKGINGATGTNTTFGANTTTSTWVSSSASGMSAPGLSGASNVKVKFRFNNQDEFYRFLCGGAAIQVEVTHTGGAATPDTNMRSFLSANGTWRITANAVRIFGQSLPLTVSRNNVNRGLLNGNPAGVTLTTQYSNNTTQLVPSMSASVTRSSNTEFILTIGLNPGGVCAGTTGVSLKLIRDTETFGSPAAPVYPAPLPFVSTDITFALAPAAGGAPPPGAITAVYLASGGTSMTPNANNVYTGIRVTAPVLPTISAYRNSVLTPIGIPTLISGTTWQVNIQSAYTGTANAGDVWSVVATAGGGTGIATLYMNPVAETWNGGAFINQSGRVGVNSTNAAAAMQPLNFYGPYTTPTTYYLTNVTLVSGTLPPGISIARHDGVQFNYVGTPTAVGTYTFSVRLQSLGSWGDTYDTVSTITFTVTA